MADESIWDSWEDFADSGDIDKHVEQGFNISNKSKKVKEKSKTSKQNDTSPHGAIRILPRPVVHEEDQNRTAYKPQLKILKRPEKSALERQSEEEERKRLMAQNPVRTLAQREAAYAEARLRIMGDEAPKTNDVLKQTVSQNDARPENLRRYSKQSKSSQQNGFSVDVKRQPKGPGNNGKGFKTNR